MLFHPHNTLKDYAVERQEPLTLTSTIDFPDVILSALMYCKHYDVFQPQHIPMLAGVNKEWYECLTKDGGVGENIWRGYFFRAPVDLPFNLSMHMACVEHHLYEHTDSEVVEASRVVMRRRHIGLVVGEKVGIDHVEDFSMDVPEVRHRFGLLYECKRSRLELEYRMETHRDFKQTVLKAPEAQFVPERNLRIIICHGCAVQWNGIRELIWNEVLAAQNHGIDPQACCFYEQWSDVHKYFEILMYPDAVRNQRLLMDSVLQVEASREEEPLQAKVLQTLMHDETGQAMDMIQLKPLDAMDVTVDPFTGKHRQQVLNFVKNGNLESVSIIKHPRTGSVSQVSADTLEYVTNVQVFVREIYRNYVPLYLGVFTRLVRDMSKFGQENYHRQVIAEIQLMYAKKTDRRMKWMYRM